MAACMALGASDANAQAKGSVKAELAEVKSALTDLQQQVVSLPTLSQAVAQLSSQLVLLEEKFASQERLNQGMPEAIDSLDALEEEMARLQTEVEYLRTNIANVEQPAVASGGGGVGHKSGMVLASADGAYSMTLGGYMHARYAAQMPGDFSGLDSSAFRLRRGRLSVKGQAGSSSLKYSISTELTKSSAPLLNYYLDWSYSKKHKLRVGQAYVPFMRSYLISSTKRVFHEFSLGQDMHRYDRDIGVWALGTLDGGKLRYHGGISNGGGRNKSNPNIDMVTALRVERSLLGAFIEMSKGDVKGTEKAALTVGMGLTHDLVSVPTVLSGIEVGNRDVDQDGINDNVRVLSSALDAQFRLKGFELSLEATWRHERWGGILDDEENRALADAVSPSSTGTRNYIGGTVEASYFILPHRLLVGARVSHGRLPVLGLGGRSFASVPRAQRALQFGGIVQLYRKNKRSVGLSYELTNFNEKDGPDPDNDLSQALIIEAQLNL